MIELNFIDANGNKIVKLTSLGDISVFFKEPSIKTMIPPAVIMYCVANHFTYMLDGTKYSIQTMTTDNVNDKILISYKPVKE